MTTGRSVGEVRTIDGEIGNKTDVRRTIEDRTVVNLPASDSHRDRKHRVSLVSVSLVSRVDCTSEIR